MPVRLTPASRVVTGPRLPGTAPRARIPRVARERRRVIEVCVPHSSTNTSRAGSTPRICLRHSARASSSRSVALRLLLQRPAPPAAAARPGCARLRAPVAGRRSPATSPTATPARRRRRETPRRARPGWHPRRPPAGPAARPAAAGAASAPGRAAARSPPGCRWPARAPDTAPRSAATPRTAPPPATGSSPHRPRPRSAHASPSSTPAPRRHSPANRHPSTNQHTAVRRSPMTLTAPRTTATHPLSRMTAEEVTAARDVVRAAGLLHESTKFVYVGLEEPHKREVLAWSPGDPVERRLRVLLLDRATGAGRDLTVSVTGGAVVRDDEIDGVAD